MPRVSATFKKSTQGIAMAYAEYNELSFSEAVEILTAATGIDWLNKLPKTKRNEYVRKYNIFKPIPHN